MRAIILVFCFSVLGIINSFSQNVFLSTPTPAILDQKIIIDNYTIRKNNEFDNKNPNDNTVGSRLFLKKWVNGIIVTSGDTAYNDPSLFFNYDKLQGNLLLQKNDNSIFAVDGNKVKSFTLREVFSNDSIKEYSFERSEIINKHSFCQVLVKNKKYSLYKIITTKFIKANYTTNGIVESGNKFDTYEDQFEFYIVFNGSNECKKVDLKKKSIKQILHVEDAKTEAYFNTHSSEKIDENFLTALIINLNQ